MPLFIYQCQNCNLEVEKFLHNRDEEAEIECESCGGVEFERLLGFLHSRTRYNARENLHKRVLPDADRIQKKVSKGSDRDFLDITGEE